MISLKSFITRITIVIMAPFLGYIADIYTYQFMITSLAIVVTFVSLFSLIRLLANHKNIEEITVKDSV